MIPSFGVVACGSVAQLVERALRMREAPGSKPGVSRVFFVYLFASPCRAASAAKRKLLCRISGTPSGDEDAYSRSRSKCGIKRVAREANGPVCPFRHNAVRLAERSKAAASGAVLLRKARVRTPQRTF